jgi:hypothetical protein
MTFRRELVRPLAVAALAALVALSLGACRKREPAPAPAPAATQAPAPAPMAPATHVEIQLGSAVGADKRVTAAATAFKPTDTIYAAATIHGYTGTQAVRALWTYQDGQTVADESQSVTADGGVTAEFHISKPDGFPAGSYTVEIFVGAASAGKTTFTVQ